MLTLLALLAAPSALAGPPLAPVQAEHIQLIDVPPSAFVRTNLLSGDGQTAGGSLQVGTRDRPFVWTESLGLRFADQGAPGDGFVQTMGSDGTHLAGQYYLNFFQTRQAARWDVATGERVDIVPPGAQISFATEISADGGVVAGEFEFASGQERVFRWTESGGVEDLGTLGGAQSFLGDMTRDGQVIVGSSQDASGRRRAFRWTPSLGLRRFAVVGSDRSGAQRVSDDGLTVVGTAGGSAYPSGVYRRVLGEPATPIPLNGATLAFAGSLLLSGDGSTVAGLASLPAGGLQAFVWTAAGGTTFVPEQEVEVLSDLSHDGSVFAGTAPPTSALSRRPIRWTLAGGTELLTNVAPDNGTAEAVSDDGSVIFGKDQTSGRNHPAIWRSNGRIGASFCGPAVPNSTGASAEAHLSGSNSLLLNGLTLEASALPPGTIGYFLVSPTPGFTFPVPGSEGALCLSGNIGRFRGPGQVQTADSTGRFTLFVQPGQLPAPTGSQAAMYGEAWYFQAWFRDANPTATSNFTDGATVRFY